MKIKICGIRQPSDVLAVNEMLPDFIGFVFAPSKRQVTKEQATALKANLNPHIKTAGVFVNAAIEDILEPAGEGVIDMVQLHGTEDELYLRTLKKQLEAIAPHSIPLIRAVRVKTPSDILAAQETEADYLLLDTFVSGQYGGSGQSFDWSMIPPIKKPYFLAGGIRVSNAAAALATAAWCMDVSSGVETDGAKDFEKIKTIMKIVRSQP